MEGPPEHGILAAVSRYYSDRLEEHGPTPAGVDWSSEQSQRLRFEQLLKLVDGSTPASILDYGCGYGALALFLMEGGLAFDYVGFDAAEEMVLAARSMIDDPRCMFTAKDSEVQVADYTLASGIFNVKVDATEGAWRAYVTDTLDAMAGHSATGFAFNMLTRFADAHMMRTDLYYADPMEYFRICKERYSRNVALLHDYDLYEFTILVRLGAPAKALVP